MQMGFAAKHHSPDARPVSHARANAWIVLRAVSFPLIPTGRRRIATPDLPAIASSLIGKETP